ncbi:MAG: D-2-hydroxyacid dehydrogenase [Pirellulaceae bacterium]|nr:D-2-hydroxyacid dehydrogenase [Pirellulaceae bacterium]
MKITVLDGYTLNPGDNPWSAIEPFGELTTHDRTSAEHILERSLDADVLLTNKTPLDAGTLEKLPNLKFIGIMATGVNVVDLAAAAKLGIPVSNVPEYCTDSVAQHVISVMLSMNHRPFEHSTAVYGGQWEKAGDFCFWLSPLKELAGKTMGVVGYGRIGKRVCELAAAFNMNVLAHNPSYRNKTRLDYLRFDWCTLEQVFRESDFVSLHCPLTVENAGFVNASLLTQMKPNALLINSARGGLINESDLAEVLQERGIGGACLDVTSTEPIQKENPLLAAPNCLITPHNAWASVEARQRLMKVTAENIEAFLSGHPINLVHPRRAS